MNFFTIFLFHLTYENVIMELIKKKARGGFMHLVEVTNSYRRMVQNQLESTSAKLIKVYTLGNTTVIYSESRLHHDIVIQNKERKIQPKEVEYAISELMPNVNHDDLVINETDERHVIDISYKLKKTAE